MGKLVGLYKDDDFIIIRTRQLYNEKKNPMPSAISVLYLVSTFQGTERDSCVRLIYAYMPTLLTHKVSI